MTSLSNTKLSHTDFNNSSGHYVDWYVYRSSQIRKQMISFWGGGKGISNKNTMEGANFFQNIVKRTNVLFRNMESHGPLRIEFQNFKYDKINKLYHAHVSPNKKRYVVLWEIDETKKIINIVRMGSHENYKFSKLKAKEDRMNFIAKERNKDPLYQQYLQHDQHRE